MARVTMKTFLAVRMFSLPRTAHTMSRLPKRPTMMKTEYTVTRDQKSHGDTGLSYRLLMSFTILLTF